MQSTKLKAPFGWIGGKSKLAKEIVEAISSEHKTYVEVFGGAMSVLYAKAPSKLEVANDINSELVNLHRCIRTNPQSLSMYLNNMLISRELFDGIKTKKNQTTKQNRSSCFLSLPTDTKFWKQRG